MKVGAYPRDGGGTIVTVAPTRSRRDLSPPERGTLRGLASMPTRKGLSPHRRENCVTPTAIVFHGGVNVNRKPRASGCGRRGAPGDVRLSGERRAGRRTLEEQAAPRQSNPASGPRGGPSRCRARADPRAFNAPVPGDLAGAATTSRNHRPGAGRLRAQATP